MQLAPTMSAAEEPDQKTLAGANRRHRLLPLPVHGITPHHSSVLFVCGPVNITYMMIADEDAALFGGASRSDVSQAGRPPARSLPDAVPKRRHQHRRDCAKYRGSGSA